MSRVIDDGNKLNLLQTIDSAMIDGTNNPI